MEFKFNMGAEVQTHNGIVGKVIARIETLAGLYYKILEADGQGHEVSQKLLWIVSCVPAWLRPGEEVQWMGEGPHERYVVKELCRGGRYRPRAFAAERELIRPDGTSCGRERVFTECTPANMAFWRPWQPKKPKAKAKASCRREPAEKRAVDTSFNQA